MVACLKDGEEQAVVRLVDRYGTRLVAAAHLLCGDWARSEDLMMETVARAVRSIETFRGESSLFSWLYGILANQSRMASRRQGRERVVYVEHLPEVPDGRADVAEQLDADQLARCLAAAINQLSPAHRDAVMLRYYRDLKLEEIAELLGVTLGTVKSRLHYANAQLRRILPPEMNLFS